MKTYYQLTLVVLLSVFSLKIEAQKKVTYTLKVNYDIHYNTARPNTQKGVLYLDNSNTKSIYKEGKNTDGTVAQDEDDNMAFSLSVRGIESFYFLDLVSDSLYSKQMVYLDEAVILEGKPNMAWQLTNEEKQLDNLKVKKATLSFRGRNYTAWYCEEYPVQFGPWKFHGLPGLILEISDETKMYHWVATRIKKIETPEVIQVDSLMRDTKQMDLKTFAAIRYNINNARPRARSPRGVTTTYGVIPRNGIEILFEWEEEPESE
ncbi:conserved hypothetical protein [Formosa agariphila KMM 3901]|uniref:GLPGLI family protein n=1 Tax=Formosa agariphila (strain DSM 15362 / KCTC 12365 / LMG 23005 / KMM 3901 / M-2Alg 35-1) TaxID=1347342 RepID=T2KRL4_FORAG|nr:GLPGLI family protein [Formosa agariphila]CDF81158.1 conserved hypothetical protein [Formosa agariphila KMM 3901]